MLVGAQARLQARQPGKRPKRIFGAAQPRRDRQERRQAPIVVGRRLRRRSGRSCGDLALARRAAAAGETDAQSAPMVLDLAWRVLGVLARDGGRRRRLAAPQPREVAEDEQGGGQAGAQAAGHGAGAARARSARRQLPVARARMLADVPNADVIVTNPTHFAVALALRRRPDRAARGREGRRPTRRRDPRARRRARRRDRREPAARPRAVRRRRGRADDPGADVRAGRRGARLRLPHRPPPEAACGPPADAQSARATPMT